jgi:hypothetical protein
MIGGYKEGSGNLCLSIIISKSPTSKMGSIAETKHTSDLGAKLKEGL